MHLNFSPLLLAGGFTKWSSLLLRVSWRRWGSVSWQLLPRNKDRRHLLRGGLESYVFHQDAEWIQRRNSILHISTTSGLVCGALTGMRSTWVMSMARHCARRVRQLSRLLSFTAQPGGGVVEFFLFKSSLNLLLQLHLACQTLKITIKTTQWRLGPIKSVLAFFSSA